MKPAVTFVADIKQETYLKRTTVYRYHPPLEMKDEIIAGISDHLKSDLTEFDNVEVKIEVILKQYDKPNDTKNTGI